jgi:hypothetical protein
VPAPARDGWDGEAESARERFLGAIAERIAPERIAELHLFPPIRQGGLESGIAVIAAYPEAPSEETTEHAAAGAVPADAPTSPAPPEPRQIRAAGGAPVHRDAGPETRERLTVYRATYRWARKGPERGKWEVDVREEGDAPLDAVEDIVRGVHRRAGGDAEPERLSAAGVRAAVGGRPWTSAT